MKVPVREIPAVVAVVAVACAVEIGLRTVTLPRLARAAGTPLRRAPVHTPGLPRHLRLGTRGRRQVRAVQRVMRHWPFGDTCLRQALVAGHRLRRFHPELVVGVAKVDGAVKAHAWLEIDSAILDPLGAAQGYLPLESGVEARSA